MKLLKIENSLGYYLDDQGTFAPIDKINKIDLLRLVGLALDQNVDLDEYNNEALKNQAHQIVYKSIFEKLRGLRDRRQEFVDESERLYLQEYEKYRDKSSQPGTEGDAITRMP